MKIIIEIKANKEIGGIDVVCTRAEEFGSTKLELRFAEAFEQVFRQIIPEIGKQTGASSVTDVNNQ